MSRTLTVLDITAELSSQDIGANWANIYKNLQVSQALVSKSMIDGTKNVAKLKGDPNIC